MPSKNTASETVTAIRRGVSILDLQRRVKIVPVEFDGETIQVRFMPHLYSSRLHNELIAGMEDPTIDVMSNLVAKLICGWDIMANEELTEEYPIEVEALAELPIGLLGAIARSVMEFVQETGGPKNET